MALRRITRPREEAVEDAPVATETSVPPVALDGNDDDDAPRVSRRPAGVPDELWAAIPENLIKEFERAVAVDAVRFIHPEVSVRRQLEARGLPTSAPSPRRAPSGNPPVIGRSIRAGAPAAASKATSPVSPVGVALHKAMRLPGAPGQDAAAAEQRLVEAIRNDPVSAIGDPTCLASAARIPEGVIEAVGDLVRWEAEKIVSDLRRRKAEGDPSVRHWIDPDDWTFNLEEDGDCAPSGPSR